MLNVLYDFMNFNFDIWWYKLRVVNKINFAFVFKYYFTNILQ